MRTAAILAALALTGCLNSHSPTEPASMTITPGPGDIYTRPTPTPTPQKVMTITPGPGDVYTPAPA